VTEDDLLTAVLSVCKLYSWRTLHIRPARTEEGWRSPLQGDGVGWPDVLAVKGSRLIAAELKGEKGKATDEQMQWLRLLDLAHVETYLWTPSAWASGSILRTLAGA
jgi:hypothetical protein